MRCDVEPEPSSSALDRRWRRDKALPFPSEAVCLPPQQARSVAPSLVSDNANPTPSHGSIRLSGAQIPDPALQFRGQRSFVSLTRFSSIGLLTLNRPCHGVSHIGTATPSALHENSRIHSRDRVSGCACPLISSTPDFPKVTSPLSSHANNRM